MCTALPVDFYVFLVETTSPMRSLVVEIEGNKTILDLKKIIATRLQTALEEENPEDTSVFGESDPAQITVSRLALVLYNKQYTVVNSSIISIVLVNGSHLKAHTIDNRRRRTKKACSKTNLVKFKCIDIDQEEKKISKKMKIDTLTVDSPSSPDKHPSTEKKAPETPCFPLQVDNIKEYEAALLREFSMEETAPTRSQTDISELTEGSGIEEEKVEILKVEESQASSVEVPPFQIDLTKVTKQAFYNVLKKEGYYLPCYNNTTVEFMQDFVVGQKKILRCSKIRFVDASRFCDYLSKRPWDRFTEDVEFQKHFPARQRVRDYYGEFFYNIVNTIKPGMIERLLEKAKERTHRPRKSKLISVLPEFRRIFKEEEETEPAVENDPTPALTPEDSKREYLYVD